MPPSEHRDVVRSQHPRAPVQLRQVVFRIKKKTLTLVYDVRVSVILNLCCSPTIDNWGAGSARLM